MSEIGHITASCGHRVKSSLDLVDVTFQDEVIDHDAGGFVPVDVFAVYCPSCAEALKGNEDGR